MSIIVPPPVESSSPADVAPTSTDADQLIERRIDQACTALWWSELTRALLKLVIVSLSITLLWVVVDQWIYSSSNLGRWVVFLALLSGGLLYLAVRVVPLLFHSIRPEYAARSLERDFPDLRQALTSYVALREDRGGARLRNRVVRSMGASTAGHLRTHDVLPSEAAGTFRWWIGTAAMLALVLAYAVASPKKSWQSAARLLAPFASIQPAMRVAIRDVQPGDTEAIAGRSVPVSAKIDGLRDDEQAVLIWKRSDDRQQTVLQFDNDSRRFSGDLSLTHADSGKLLYSIEAGDAIAGPYELLVQDVPVVAIASIQYQPPAYTRGSPWTGSGGAIHALDGTEVTILATTNRPIVKANIEFNPRQMGDTIQATAGVTAMKIMEDGMSVSVTFPLRSSRGRSAAVQHDSYRINVWDSADQRNPDPIIYPIQIINDLPPEVAIMLPIRSPKDLPFDSQQVIEIHASDPDFGLQQVSLEIRSGIDLLDQPVLWSDPQGATGNQVAEYRFRPRQHGLRIGDTVQVIAVATDNRVLDHDRSVEPNVTRTDAIEFHIVASEPPPRPGDPQADGLSAPDERPASDPDAGNAKAGNQEGQQQGGSGGSEGDGQPQQGGSSDGAGSSGKQAESADDGQQSGAGSSDGQGQAKSQEQKSPQDDSPQDDSSSNGDLSSNGDPDAGQANEGASSAEQSGTAAESNPRDPRGNQQGRPAQPTSANGTGADQDPAAQSDQLPNNDDSGGKSNDRRSQANRERSGEQNNTPENAGQPDSQRSEDESGAAAPQHDGEAFERIRDHLQQKRKEQQPGKPPAGDHNPGQQPAANQQGSKDQASPVDPSVEEKKPAEKSQGQEASDDRSTGTDSSGQDSGSPTKPSSSTNKDGQENGNQAADPNGAQEDQGADGDGDSGNQSDTQGEPSQTGKDPGKESGESGGKNNPSADSAASEPGDSNGDSESSSESTSGSQQGSESSGATGDKPSPQPGNSSDPAAGQPSDSGNPADRSRDAQSQSESQAGQPAKSNSNDQPGTGGQGESLGGDSVLPPEPSNAQYAKQATDMVLDYLDQTRDDPDRELLEKLNWTESDLQRFADRWQKVRELSKNDQDPVQSREISEALKSLGLKPSTSESKNNIRESADPLRSLRDAGNRRPPPAAYRDAFDAFRRAAGRP